MKTIQFVKTVMIGMLCAGMFSPTSCTKDETVQKSSEKELSNFRIAAGGEIFTGVVQPNGTTIQFVSPYGFDQEYLKTATPSFDLSKGATASPVSGKSQDFTKDVVYTVTAEDGSTAVYTVHKVDGTTSDAYFLEFSIYVVGDTYQGTIDDENSIIYFSPALNKWDDLEEDAVPTFTLAPGATASPESGVVQNFQQDVVYIVTAQDGTVREWTVKRTNRTGNAIDYFYLKPEGYDRIVGKIDAATHTVTIEYPVFGEDFTPAALTMYPEVIQISLGATVSPDWNVDCDFSQDVTYTVTAENGDQQEWTIIVPERYVQRKWK
ncbi:MAG: DUF5018 domain-containing protein, partial [Bacteroidales bacterium]|nr:DUF5018 domain-containing protein [Bacteroidales bacterium]